MSNSKTTKSKIIEAAMSSVAELGLEATTFQTIADRAKISQPLVVYHLKSRENIFMEIFKHILDVSLTETETALAKHSSAADRLRQYAETSLSFFRSHAAIPSLYIAFYYLSSFHPHYRAMNDQLKQEATARILNIIALGLGAKEFKTPHPALAAKMIHNCITGLLLNLATEHSKYKDTDLLEEIKKTCLSLVGYGTAGERKKPSVRK